jgi:hypothetical protein
MRKCSLLSALTPACVCLLRWVSPHRPRCGSASPARSRSRPWPACRVQTGDRGARVGQGAAHKIKFLPMLAQHHRQQIKCCRLFLLQQPRQKGGLRLKALGDSGMRLDPAPPTPKPCTTHSTTAMLPTSTRRKEGGKARVGEGRVGEGRVGGQPTQKAGTRRDGCSSAANRHCRCWPTTF